MTKPVRGALVALVSSVALLSAGATTAMAGLGAAGSFSAEGTDPGLLSAPQRVTIHQATGDVYVVDDGTDQVQIFAGAGDSATYLAEFGGGVLDDPNGIAIDEDNGDVYVSDSGGTRIVRFSSDGAATPSFAVDAGWTSPAGGARFGAIAFAQAANSLVVADPGDKMIKRYDTSGAPAGTSFDGSSSGTAFSNILDLAVDSTGDVVVVNTAGTLQDLIDTGTGSQVERFDAAGGYEGVIGPIDGGAYLVATDPDDDMVHVAGNANSYWNGGPLTIAEFRADGTPLAVGTVPSTDDTPTVYGMLGGLAARGDGDDHVYAVSARSPFDPAYGAVKGWVFREFPEPAVTLEPTTNVSSTTATLHGTVDAQGLATSYHFEVKYSDDWHPLADHDAGSGMSSVAVDDEATGLLAGLEYRVRLIATGPGGTTISSEGAFNAAIAAPLVRTTAPTAVTTHTATPAGVVDPQGAASIYWFEYGTDTSYGSSSPASHDAALNDPFPTGRELSRTVDGLAEATTYHYRLVARNVAGTTFGADRILRTREASAALADGRAYEMVSPPAKNGYDVRETITKARSSGTGDAVAYPSIGTFPGTAAVGSALDPRYLAHRTSERWVTQSIDPPLDAQHLAGAGGMMNDPQESGNFSDDLLTSAVFGLTKPLAPGAETDRVELYRRATLSNQYELVSKAASDLPLLTGNALIFAKPIVAATTHDLGHIVFETTANLLPETTGDNEKTYEWDHGVLRVVGVLPDGTVAPDARPGSNSGHWSFNKLETSEVMSEDGTRIVFSTESDGRLFLRDSGGTPAARTAWVSESEKAVPDPSPAPATFRDASQDGSTVLFTTDEALVDDDTDAGTDLYGYDLDAPAGHHLTLISRDGEAADGSSAAVLGVLGISRDGGRIYFAAGGQLVPGKPTDPGQAKLYLLDHGQLRYITTFDGSDDENALNWTEVQDEFFTRRKSRVSPDGRYVLFQRDGATRWALYDAEDGTETCVSCDPAGTDPTGALPREGRLQMFSEKYLPRQLVVRDGHALVFFDSEQPLSGQDTNGRRDVYRYSSADRSLALISSGTGPDDSFFVDASADGRDAFFVTRDRLSHWDIDALQDLYDARIGGGLPEPGATLPCVEDECQGQPGAVPVQSSAGSVTFSGRGNALAAPASVKPGKVTISKARPIIGSRGTLKVRVPMRGQLSLSGFGLRTAKKSVTKAGIVTVTVALTERGRGTLRKRHRVKTRARIVYKPSGGGSLTAGLSLTFTAPVTKGH